MRKHILTSDFFWQMTARMSRWKNYSGEQRSLTQILIVRMAGSEFCCMNKEDIQRLSLNLDVQSRLIQRTKRPDIISAGDLSLDPPIK